MIDCIESQRVYHSLVEKHRYGVEVGVRHLTFDGRNSRRTCNGLDSVDRKSLSSTLPTNSVMVGALCNVRHEIK